MQLNILIGISKDGYLSIQSHGALAPDHEMVCTLIKSLRIPGITWVRDRDRISATLRDDENIRELLAQIEAELNAALPSLPQQADSYTISISLLNFPIERSTSKALFFSASYNRQKEMIIPVVGRIKEELERLSDDDYRRQDATEDENRWRAQKIEQQRRLGLGSFN